MCEAVGRSATRDKIEFMVATFIFVFWRGYWVGVYTQSGGFW